MVVGRVRGTESTQLCHLSLEPSVLLCQRLAAALQVLAVHLGLLQLRPVRDDVKLGVFDGGN